jgi:hypothetical protein
VLKSSPLRPPEKQIFSIYYEQFEAFSVASCQERRRQPPPRGAFQTFYGKFGFRSALASGGNPPI